MALLAEPPQGAEALSVLALPLPGVPSPARVPAVLLPRRRALSITEHAVPGRPRPKPTGGSPGDGSGGRGPPRPGSLRPSRVLQKWQCVEDASGKLKLHKCKGPARLGGRALSNLVPKYYAQGSETCACDTGDYKLSLASRRKKLFKKSECGPGGREGAGGSRRGRRGRRGQEARSSSPSKQSCGRMSPGPGGP